MINKRTMSLVLTITGVLGVGATSWLAVKCSRKADTKTTKKEKIFAYAPAIACGVGTVGCIVGSHTLSRKEIAALTATCTYLTANRDRIEKKIKERLGDEAYEDVKTEVAKEELQETKKIEEKPKQKSTGQTIEETGYGNDLFLDLYLGRKFRSSLERVEWAIKQLNNDFHNGNWVCMNDWYDYLGIAPSRAGDQFGWPADEDYYDYNLETPIEFDIVDCVDENTGEKMYAVDIRFGFRPTEFWDQL